MARYNSLEEAQADYGLQKALRDYADLDRQPGGPSTLELDLRKAIRFFAQQKGRACLRALASVTKAPQDEVQPILDNMEQRGLIYAEEGAEGPQWYFHADADQKLRADEQREEQIGDWTSRILTYTTSTSGRHTGASVVRAIGGAEASDLEAPLHEAVKRLQARSLLWKQ